MHLAVIGNDIVGTACAAWLQRDGHRVTFIDPKEPGEATSFGNAGSLSPSACLPVGMPGMWKKVPGWLLDPLGPLTIRWSYAPFVAPWIWRFMRHTTPAEVTRIATAVPTANQILAYWWCSPPRTGRPIMRPVVSAARDIGASLFSDR